MPATGSWFRKASATAHREREAGAMETMAGEREREAQERHTAERGQQDKATEGEKKMNVRK